MTIYYFLFVSMALLFISLLIHFYFLRDEEGSMALFIKALKNENDGNFSEALVTYENAMCEINKKRFHTDLKNKIAGKLRLLRTLIEYEKNFTRISEF